MSAIFKPDFNRGPFGCIIPLMLYGITSIMVFGPHVQKGQLSFVHHSPPSPKVFNGLTEFCPIGSIVPTVEPTCAIPVNFTTTMDPSPVIDFTSATQTGVDFKHGRSTIINNNGFSLLAYFAFTAPILLILILAASLVFALVSLYSTPGETGGSPVQNAAGDIDTPEDEHPCPATNVAGGSGGDRGRGGNGPSPPHAYIPSLKHDLAVLIIGFIFGFLAYAIISGKLQALFLHIGTFIWPILQDAFILLCNYLSSTLFDSLRTFFHATVHHIRRGMVMVTGIFMDESEVEEDLEDWTIVQTPTPTKKKRFSFWSVGRHFGTPTGSPRRPARPIDSPSNPTAHESGSQGEQSPIHPPFPEVVSNRGIAQLLLDEGDVIPGSAKEELVNRFPVNDISVAATSTPKRDGVSLVEEGVSFEQDKESANNNAATSDGQVAMGASDSVLAYLDKKRYPYDYFPMRDDVNKESHNNGFIQNQNLNLRAHMTDGDHPANTSDCTEESRIGNYSFVQDAHPPTPDSVVAAEHRSEKRRFMKACLNSPPSGVVDRVVASPHSEAAVPAWRVTVICATPPRQYPGGPFILPTTPPSAPPTPEQLSFAPYKIAYTGDGSVVEEDMDIKDRIWEARIEGTPLPTEESFAKNLFREAVELATKKLLETIPNYGPIPRVVVEFPTPPRNPDGSYNIPNTPPSAPASPERNITNAPLRPSRSWDDVVSAYTQVDKAFKYAPAGGSGSSSPPREESVAHKLQFSEAVPTKIPRPVAKGVQCPSSDPFDLGKLRVVPRSRRPTGTPDKRDD